jgi:hypothetical protein
MTMTTFDLETLGFTKDELSERVVERICEQLLTTTYYDEDDEDGEPCTRESQVSRSLKELVKTRLDAKVAEIAEKHVLPKIDAMVEDLSLQETNKWGEKKGSPVTFIEYLVERAERYLTEEVNYDGKSRKEADSYSFRAYGTRVSQLVHKQLDFEIKIAMEQAVKTVNHNLKEGLAKTVQIKLEEIAKALKVEIKTA